VTSEQPPPRETDRWGIDHVWVDAHDEVRRVSDQTVARMRAAIGEPPHDLDARAPVVIRPGGDLGDALGDGPRSVPVEVACEDGTTRRLEGTTLPRDFPLGYHRVRTPQGHDRLLVVSPGRCWLPEGWRAWGWTVQLYATRSRDSWGIGDLADLRAVREWAQSAGAGFLLVNPLHAVAPTFPQEASPYLPATRRFRNPLYLRVEEAPETCAERGRALNTERLIDRDEVWRRKRDALENQYRSGGADDPEFARWRGAQAGSLQDFALWCALAEEHGPDWREWAADLHDPSGPAAAAAAERYADRVTFHAWLQWLLDVQLRSATGDLTVIQDLPIGVDGGGADAWAWQGTLAGGVSVGAPPDLFNQAGQDWGSPPLTPWRLRAAEYRPFIESVRATMAGAGGVRIDHVMGLFRLWWVPSGAGPAEGAYVRYPSEEMLDIVALESHRARAIVVGEDLGTVEPGVREALDAHDILSYRLLWFERDDPEDWPVKSMAAVTTHDLPTVAGLWSGADVTEQARYVEAPRAELERGREELLGRLKSADLEPSATPAEAAEAAHRLLARAPSVLLAATLEDAVAEQQRPNLPGVVERPNWRLSLPVTVEELPEHPTAAAVAETLDAAVRSPQPRPKD
jgi:4-alpha-glucanotransferase